MIPGQPQPTQGALTPQPQGAPAPMAQQQPQVVTIDDVMELLRDNVLRRFRIDIEVDSTIVGDESQERQDRSQFIEATTKFISAWGPLVAANPLLAPMAGQLLLFGARSFRIGNELEEVIEETVDKIEAHAANPPLPQPNPAEQAKLQATQMKAKAEIQKAQIGAQQAQVEGQLKIAAAEMDHRHRMAEHSMDMQKLQEQQRQTAIQAVMAQQQPGIIPPQGSAP